VDQVLFVLDAADTVRVEIEDPETHEAASGRRRAHIVRDVEQTLKKCAAKPDLDSNDVPASELLRKR
jgi:hypothetical protein